jgi:hypothetical protein
MRKTIQIKRQALAPMGSTRKVVLVATTMPWCPCRVCRKAASDG